MAPHRKMSLREPCKTSDPPRTLLKLNDRTAGQDSLGPWLLAVRRHPTSQPNFRAANGFGSSAASAYERVGCAGSDHSPRGRHSGGWGRAFPNPEVIFSVTLLIMNIYVWEMLLQHIDSVVVCVLCVVVETSPARSTLQGASESAFRVAPRGKTRNYMAAKFVEGQLVWAKVDGLPSWPALVKHVFEGDHGKRVYDVEWLGLAGEQKLFESKEQSLTAWEEKKKPLKQLPRSRGSHVYSDKVREEYVEALKLGRDIFEQKKKEFEENYRCVMCGETDGDSVVCDGCGKAYHYDTCIHPVLTQEQANNDPGWLCCRCDTAQQLAALDAAPERAGAALAAAAIAAALADVGDAVLPQPTATPDLVEVRLRPTSKHRSNFSHRRLLIPPVVSLPRR